MVAFVPAAAVDLAAQLLFHLYHIILRFCQSEALADALHVRINGKAGNIETDAADDIGGLTPDTGQRHELLA